MKRILVTYATMAGSTAEVADVVAEELAGRGLAVDVLPIAAVDDLGAYDGVVVGAPMIMGWHRAARRFLRRHRAAFRETPLAIFVLAMSLIESEETGADGVPLFVDEKLPEPPSVAGRLTFRERFTCLSNYLRPILRAVRPHKPLSIAVFGGRLEYGRLPWWGVLFAMMVIRVPAGERRNWEAIRTWASALPEAMVAEEAQLEPA